jgi:hypothetical protein
METDGDDEEDEVGDRPVSRLFPYYAGLYATPKQDMEHPGELGLSDDDDSADYLAASAARRLNLSQLPFPSLGDHDDDDEEEEDGGDGDGDDGDVWRSIAAASEALGREIVRVRELAKEADAGGGGGGGGWFYRYAGACRRMPRLVVPAALSSPFVEIVGTHATRNTQHATRNTTRHDTTGNTTGNTHGVITRRGEEGISTRRTGWR